MKTSFLTATGLLLALSALNLWSAIRTWDGSANGLLSNAANWQEGIAPVNGDELVFPASGVSRFNVTNNIIGGPRFPTITFNGNGFTLYGGFIVTSRIGAENLAGVNRINCALQLSTNGTFFINGDTGALLDIDGDVAIGPYTLSVSAGGGSLFIGGVISGTGSISKISGGTVRFDGTDANTYTGLTTVFGGTLELFKGPANTLAVPGDLMVSGAADVVRLLRNNQLSSNSDVSLGPSALLDLQAFSTPLRTLTLNGGQVTGGTLSLGGDVTATSVPGSLASISGNLAIGVGPRTFTVTDNLATNPDLDISARISGVGGIIKTGAGTLAFSGSLSNNFVGATRVFEGTLLLRRAFFDLSIPGNLFIGDGVGGPSSDVVRLENFAQINNLSAVIIASSGLLDQNGISEAIGALIGEGYVEVDGNSLGVGVDGGSTTYSGQIVGTGGLTKMGLGTLTLTGTNSYSGPTLVADGTLLVDGLQWRSPVTVTSGTLGGNGTVSDLSVSGGNLSPGASPGRLTCSNLTFSAQSHFFVELHDGPPGLNGHDQMNVQGSVTLNNATLHLSGSSGFTEGQRFVIIENDGTDPVTGTFAGLPNGSVLTLNNLQFLLLYNNPVSDVVLVVTNTPLRFISSSLDPVLVSSGNLDSRIDLNECPLIHLVLTNTSSTPVTGIRTTLLPDRTGWSVTQPFSTYPDLGPGEMGTNQVPFQISILPGTVCGLGFGFEMLIETANHGLFRSSPPSYSFAHSGTPVRFDNNTPLVIPDASTANSIINISGIHTPIREVKVSLYISHPATEDLDITLIAPNTEFVRLSFDHGGAATNYGIGCADNQRTVFADGFSNPSIATASAPFVGTFRPDIPLSLLSGNFESGVNGPWTLRVADDTAGDVGALLCWSLFISPSACADGGGTCESCPERTIFGSISEHSELRGQGRLVRNGNASVCGAAKSCPGAEDLANQLHFDAYIFENGESNACITVTLGVALDAGCDLFSAAYASAFNPADVCANYLGEMGSSLTSGETNSYAFNVAAHARFVIVVSQSEPSSDQCRYRLAVTGGSCRPVLHIDSPFPPFALLDWTTAAVGYQLERTNALAAPSAPQWLPVATTPGVTNSRFQITDIVPEAARFYRLRKP